MPEIKKDPQNYRMHDKRNKEVIAKSLSECGAGRSILLDSEDGIIAGNGVFEQAEKLNIPVKIIETDGTELIAVKRTDLKPEDEKRRNLSVMDNSTSDLSTWDWSRLTGDFDEPSLYEMGIELPELDAVETDLEDIERPDIPLKGDVFELIIECESEQALQTLYDKMKAEGHKCRVSTF